VSEASERIGRLLVTWLSFTSTILLPGAVVDAVLATSAPDRQVQQAAVRTVPTMTAEDGADGETPPPDDPTARDNPTQAELDALRAELDEFRDDIEDRTLHREEIESDLRRYVRRRLRRGHARGWGPYVVLLYGTIMTLGAFYYLSAGWAILAMLVVWLSTLGLYVVMIVAGLGIGAAGLPQRLLDRFRN